MFRRLSSRTASPLALTARAQLSTGATSHGLILGCGSNVMDLFFRVRSLPGPGEKQYFAGTQVLSASVVGGSGYHGVIVPCCGGIHDHVV